MFAPVYGVPEDPATGSANLALAALLASLRPEPDLALRWRIAQGAEMGRPSLLDAAAEKRGGSVVATRIGGRCVAVMTGTIDIQTLPKFRAPAESFPGIKLTSPLTATEPLRVVRSHRR